MKIIIKKAGLLFLSFITVFKLSTDNILFYYSHQGWTSSNILVLVSYCLQAQESVFGKLSFFIVAIDHNS